MSQQYFKLFLYNFIITIFLFGCHNTNNLNLTNDFKSILDLSGKNRGQLLKIIDHYSNKPQDSLKLKAAYYLLTGLRDRHYYEGKLLDNYLQYSKLVKRDLWHGDYIRNSFESVYGPFDIDELKKKPHLENLIADSVIKDIDFCFRVRDKQPWGKKYDFRIFCENILPFYISDEIPSFSREKIYKRYNPIIDSIRKKGLTVMQAGYLINEKLKRDRWTFSLKQSAQPHLGPDIILKYRVGSCRELADLGTYVMRSVGIAVGNDFLPQWPDRSSGHNWNVIFDENNRFFEFLGAEDSPGEGHMLDTKKGKIFRHTYKINSQSLAMCKAKDENIPDFLKDPYIKDVTDEYVRCFNVKLAIKPQAGFKHAYLCLFDNEKWVPVDWGKIEKDSVKFSKLEGGIAYMPGFYDDNQMIMPAGAPFIVTEDGNVNILSGEKTKAPISFSCNQICKVVAQFIDPGSLIGGRFYGANKKDFTDKKLLYEIDKTHKAKNFWNKISISDNNKYRYLQFKPRIKNPTDCNLSEFRALAKGEKIKGRLFCARQPKPEGLYKTENVSDGDFGTSFLTDIDLNDKSWIAFEFDKPLKIDEIQFAPGMHKKGLELYVIPGHEYELWYWLNDTWNTLESQKANNNILHFNLNHQNVLLKLHDKTAKLEERIFTYQDGKVLWY